jgi:hypothetical protein
MGYTFIYVWWCGGLSYPKYMQVIHDVSIGAADINERIVDIYWCNEGMLSVEWDGYLLSFPPVMAFLDFY